MSPVRTVSDPLESRRRVVKTRSVGTKGEIRCPHSYLVSDLIRVSSTHWTIFSCKPCINDLIYTLNRILYEAMKDARPEILVDGNVGAYCHACEQRKTGRFYQTNVVDLQRVVDPRTSSESISKKWDHAKLYCEECYQEINRPRAILRTKKNIFIPAEVDDKIVKRLWQDALAKTDKIFTLVPTVLLKDLMKSLPESKQKSITLSLPELEHGRGEST